MPPLKKFGLFYFDAPPWENWDEPYDDETRLFIGPTEWIVQLSPGTKYEKSSIVTIKWPVEVFSNYLKVARDAHQQEFNELSATLLYTSNGMFYLSSDIFQI